jgi:hypothetical protein
MVAFACKISYDNGLIGYVSFESKPNLIAHYKKELKAHLLFGNFMAIDSKSAAILIEQYSPKK